MHDLAVSNCFPRDRIKKVDHFFVVFVSNHRRIVRQSHCSFTEQITALTGDFQLTLRTAVVCLNRYCSTVDQKETSESRTESCETNFADSQGGRTTQAALRIC